MEDVESFNKVLADAKSGNKISQYWATDRYFKEKGTQVDKKESITSLANQPNKVT